MLWLIPGCGARVCRGVRQTGRMGQVRCGMKRGWLLTGAFAAGAALAAGAARAQQGVPRVPPPEAKAQMFRDKHAGVRFEVPPGWSLARQDKEISSFRLDARSAPEAAEVRAVAGMDFNPFPLSTFSGALVSFSMEPKATDAECEAQALKFGEATQGTRKIGGSDFVHGHDEHGRSCVEARDEIYTVYRKGRCYRFDLTVNTFCAASSGAQEMSVRQYDNVMQRMDEILDSVKLEWKAPARHGEAPGRRKLPLPEAKPRTGVVAAQA